MKSSRSRQPATPSRPTAKGGGPAKEEPHYLGHRKRLRARFVERGPEALADYELLEMLLFLADTRHDTKPAAKRLMKLFGGFANVLAAEPGRLREVEGVGPRTVETIKLVHAITARALRGAVDRRPVINSWSALLDYCQARIGFARREEFHVLFLDSRNALIADEAQQTGTVDHVPVYPREVVKRALELGAAAVILVHNHPSGNLTPSEADVDMTRQVAKAAKSVGIAVHDHVIVGRGDHASFKALGLI